VANRRYIHRKDDWYLGNITSYGIDLPANGIRWGKATRLCWWINQGLSCFSLVVQDTVMRSLYR
jgi:hypothetical protein